MADENQTIKPLNGDPSRQAIPSLKGYAYQIWRTIEQWVKLKPSEILYIECAEDMDIATPHGTTAVQIKNTDAKISLSNSDAQSAIIHYWQLAQKTSEKVFFQFLTRGDIATERGEILNRRQGIKVWRDAANGDTESGKHLRNYLLENFKEEVDFHKYIQNASVDFLQLELFKPFQWITSEPDESVIRTIIRRRLIQYGEKLSFSPSVSEKVMNDLYTYCWDVAKRKSPNERSLSIEDFKYIFEEATSVRVPINAVTDFLSQPSSASSQITLSAGLKLWTDEIPPLPEPILPRELLVKTALEYLKYKVPLVITASTGKGKTTLAKLISLAARKKCIWVDLSGRENHIAESALSNLALKLDDYPSDCLVVIDDLQIDHNTDRGILTAFAILQRSCVNSGSNILVTSKGIPRERLHAELLSFSPNILEVEDLNEDEVAEFLEKVGCPKSLSITWAKITLVQTGGHPKLVHVRALDLNDKVWPNPSSNSFIETPSSIAGQRANERLNVASRESGPRLEFLYVITLLSQPFDREFILRLGSKIAGLFDPGNVLDDYLGRWIEPFYSSYYRVTSLLSNEAMEAWPDKKVKEAHGIIYDSFVEDKVINISYVFSILMHAYLSNSIDRISHCIGIFSSIDDKHFAQLASELKLIVHFGEGVGNLAIQIFPQISLMFRVLQFKVATREAPEQLNRISEEWLWEIDNLDTIGLSNGSEFQELTGSLWAVLVASTTVGNISPKLIISSILKIDELNATGKTPEVPLAILEESGSDDIVSILFSFFQVRCKSVDYLDILLDEMIKIPSEQRTRMLNAFKLSHVTPYGFIVQNAWVDEFNKPEPNWDRTIEVLDKTIFLSKEWDERELGLAAIKAKSIILDESLNDREQAVSVLENGQVLFGDSYALTDQLANIYYQHAEYFDALRCWESALSLENGNKAGKIKDPFSFRKAAISAGEISEFGKSANLFVRGGYFAKEVDLNHTSSGLYFDAGFAFFCDNQLDEMCTALRMGLDELFGNSDPETDFKRFALQKLSGHVILWIRNEITGDDVTDNARPIFGCCSNPDYDIRLKELPPSPSIITILHVVELEHDLALRPKTFEKYSGALQKSNIPYLKMRLAMINLELMFRNNEFENLLSGIENIGTTMAAANAQRRLGQNVYDEYNGRFDVKDHISLYVESFLLCALTTHILLGGNGKKLIGIWGEKDKIEHSNYFSESIKNLLMKIDEVSSNPSNFMYSSEEDWFTRVVATHILITTKPISADISAFSQIAYITWLMNTDVRNILREMIPVLCKSYAVTWSYHVENKSLFINPRKTIPDLQHILEIKLNGPSKLSKLFGVLTRALNITISQETFNWLSKVDYKNNYLLR